MIDHVVKIELFDMQISVIVFDQAFSMKQVGNSARSLERLKAVHKHADYEIFFITQGQLTVVSGMDTVVCERSLIVIPPLLEHYTVGNDFEGYALNFVVSQRANNKKPFYGEAVKRLASVLTTLTLTEEEIFYVKRIAECLSGKLSQNTLQPLIYLLFSELFSRMEPLQDPVRELLPKKQTKYINLIETYISQHYSEDIGLEDVAKEINLCKKQVSRIVQKEYKCSFPELVTRQRLAAACMLLQHTTLRIYEVAENVGYRNHDNYFCALFKKKYAMTPTQYRKQEKYIAK